jgi:Flp pilus assembly protein TadB
MMQQLAVVCGLGFGAGLWLLANGLSRRLRHPSASVASALRRVGGKRAPLRLAAALASAATIALLTRWPVAGLLAGLATWTAPGMLASAQTSLRAQARLEAVAAWTESLRGTLQAAAGLEQAIIATAPTASEAIRGEVTALAAAIRSGVRLPAALRAFATDLNHPDADRVAAALLLAATGHARNLTEQLEALAAAAREQAAARLRVHTEWSTTRTSVRVIIVITVLMASGMIAFNREFLAPYDTAGGQVILAVVGGMFAAGFAWLAKVSRIEDPPRVLADPGRPVGAAAVPR